MSAYSTPINLMPGVGGSDPHPRRVPANMEDLTPEPSWGGWGITLHDRCITMQTPIKAVPVARIPKNPVSI